MQFRDDIYERDGALMDALFGTDRSQQATTAG
jgi:hypothetical protein